MERVIGLIASATRGHTKCVVFCGGEGNPYDRAAAKELYSHTSTCITGNADEYSKVEEQKQKIWNAVWRHCRIPWDIEIALLKNLNFSRGPMFDILSPNCAMITIPLAKEYKRPVYDALILQAIVCVLSGMVLDGGRFAHTVFLALLAFWCGATMIILRRPKAPTKWDLVLVRFGFLPLVVLTFALAGWVWSWNWIWRIRGV